MLQTVRVGMKLVPLQAFNTCIASGNRVGLITPDRNNFFVLIESESQGTDSRTDAARGYDFSGWHVLALSISYYHSQITAALVTFCSGALNLHLALQTEPSIVNNTVNHRGAEKTIPALFWPRKG